MNHIACIQVLLSLGAPMELVNNDGKTCYEVCFTDGGREICESFGYSYVTKEDPVAKRAIEEMEAAKKAQAAQIEQNLKKLEMMRNTNSMIRREHAKPADDFPEDSFLQVIKPTDTKAARSYYDEEEDNEDASGLLKPSAFLKEVAQEGGATNPYAAVSRA
jgi:hypothetical protein